MSVTIVLIIVLLTLNSEAPAPVMNCKSRERFPDAAPESDDFIQLAHLVRRGELLDLLRQPEVSAHVLRIRGRHQLLQPAADQKRRLRSVAEQRQTGPGSGFGDGGEIDMGGDVLQTDERQWIIMGAIFQNK